MSERENLRGEFQQESAVYLSKLETALSQIQDDHNNATAMNSAFYAIHSIKGTASLFALQNIVDLAGNMEKIIGKLRDGKMLLDSEVVNQLLAAYQAVDNMLGDMERSGQYDISSHITALAKLHTAKGCSDNESFELWDLWNDVKPAEDNARKQVKALQKTAAEKSSARNSPVASQQSKIVYFLNKPNAFAALISRLDNFGYEVQSFDDCAEFQQAIEAANPYAVIVDGDLWLTTGNIFSGRFPVFFLSGDDDMDTRYLAIRAGANVFYKKESVPLNDLISQLDNLHSHDDGEPYRIFIVEDDLVTAKWYSSLLEQAGMVTYVNGDSARLLDKLAECSPDLILMDLYMPNYTGIELAQIIRQSKEYVSIPIVFLSSEEDTSKQLWAMSQGGDDFLTKPMKDEHLIVAIKNRVQRYRVLRSYMIRDALTGLLNHSVLKDRLAVELSRQQRSGKPLVFAMIDVDYFKEVNDTYGHHTGDQVLCMLSRLLRQRLRPTDIIGRYGGEEFAVILVDTDETEAKLVLEDVRRRFGHFLHQSGTTEFRVTLSCGVAVAGEETTCLQLINSADQALYRAKGSGRNQLVVGKD